MPPDGEAGQTCGRRGGALALLGLPATDDLLNVDAAELRYPMPPPLLGAPCSELSRRWSIGAEIAWPIDVREILDRLAHRCSKTTHIEETSCNQVRQLATGTHPRCGKIGSLARGRRACAVSNLGRSEATWVLLSSRYQYAGPLRFRTC